MIQNFIKRYHRQILLIASFCIFVFWMGWIHGSLLNPNEEIGYDAFYHGMIAEAGPSVYLADKFPWTQTSIWAEHFADKEMLFHLLSTGFLRIQEFFGYPARAPFVFPLMGFFAILYAGWLFAARRLKIDADLIFAATLLPFSAICVMLFRFQLFRPHVFAVAQFLLMFGLLTGTSFRRQLLWSFIGSVIFAWSYSNPHFIIAVPFVFAVGAFRRIQWKAALLPLTSLLGVVFGCIARPQAGNYFLIWKTQGFDAILQRFTTKIQYFPLPDEMKPLPVNSLFLSIVLPLLLGMALFLYFHYFKKIPFSKVPDEAIGLCILAVVFGFGGFIVQRAFEYGGPFIVLSNLYLLQKIRNGELQLPEIRIRKWIIFAGFVCIFLTTYLLRLRSTAFLFLGICAVLVIIWKKVPNRTKISVLIFSLSIPAMLFSYTLMKNGSNARHSLPQMTAWFHEHLKPGEVIINLNWGDFPQLFYSMPEYRYQWGLDPAFALAGDREKAMMLIQSFPNYLANIPAPTEYYKKFNCRYAVLLHNHIQHAAILYIRGWKLAAYFNEPGKEEGWIFDLTERVQNVDAKKMLERFERESKRDSKTNYSGRVLKN